MRVVSVVEGTRVRGKPKNFICRSSSLGFSHGNALSQSSIRTSRESARILTVIMLNCFVTVAFMHWISAGAANSGSGFRFR